MVQLHAAKAGVPLNRPTLDVDIVLHIETGAAVFNEVKKQLEDLGYELRWSLQDDDPIHRLTRGGEKTPEIVNVMLPDHLPPRHVPNLKGTPASQAPGKWEEHTLNPQSLLRTTYAASSLKKKKKK